MIFDQAIALLICDAKAKDFHEGKPLLDHMDYYEQAKATLNTMSNGQLLQLLDRVYES